MSETEYGVKEAMLWEKLEDGSVRCHLCSHHCRVAQGKRGICGVRENRDGVLYTLVYGKAIASHVDPIEKKPLFHFMPGSRAYSIATVGCNFRCAFCQNWTISQAPFLGDGRIPGDSLPPEAVVRQAQAARCRSISYTYTEPTIFFEYAIDAARLAHEAGLKNTFVTNGFESPDAVRAMTGLIDAANVDLKSFSDEFYKRYCKARLQPVLDSIANMVEAGIFVEVTTLIIPGLNDSPFELREIAKFLVGLSPDIPWHVSRFHPDFQALQIPPTPAETIYRAIDIGREAGLHYVFAGNLPGGHFEDTVCPHCGETVIKRYGFSISRMALNGSRCGHCNAELKIVTT